jgi:flagellar basal-body rod protein FlgC
MMNKTANINNVFDISGRAMAAQMVRLNTIASNLANASAIAGSSEEAYRAVRPIFETKYAKNAALSGMSTIDTQAVVQLRREPEQVHMPEHPKADKDGFIYTSAVSAEEEMVDMLDANRQYQNNIEVVTTVRALMMRTISMGK